MIGEWIQKDFFATYMWAAAIALVASNGFAAFVSAERERRAREADRGRKLTERGRAYNGETVFRINVSTGRYTRLPERRSEG